MRRRVLPGPETVDFQISFFTFLPFEFTRLTHMNYDETRRGEITNRAVMTCQGLSLLTVIESDKMSEHFHTDTLLRRVRIISSCSLKALVFWTISFKAQTRKVYLKHLTNNLII